MNRSIAYFIYPSEQSSNDEETDHDLIWAQLLSFRDSGYDQYTHMYKYGGGISCGDYNANLHNFQFMWCYVLIPNDFETVT